MPAQRQNPLLRGRVSDDGTRILWHGVDGKRFETIKKFLKGQEIDIVLAKHAKKRSGRQNRYYRGVVVEMIAEAAGYSTNEEAHDALRIHFLRVHHDDRPPTIKSTSQLTTQEFEDYLAKCRQLAAEMWGIYIPEPNEAPPE